uniref:Uncharacterized protein n=1 Tax=Plectus sambesii TaxID=2011161 RepID=A0A914VEI1_9BILA
MQLVKPPWINHGGGAIYSLDIHPSGKKVVTCGQGSQGGSGVVNVWNLTPVLDEKAGIDENVPKLLSRMLHTRE